MLFDPLTMSLTQLRVKYICVSASADAHIFMLIYSLPLVHRPKGGHSGIMKFWISVTPDVPSVYHYEPN